MQLNHKVKLVTISQHIIAITGIWYYGLSVASIATLLFFYFVYFGLGISGGYHKLFCHRSFETTKFWRRLLLAIGTTSGFGSSIAWSLSHRLHHMNSDQSVDKDPYYPQGGFWAKVRAWAVTPRNVPYNPLVIRDMLKDPEQMFIHLHYFKILGLFLVILTAINPWLTVFVWAIPNVLGYHAIQAVGVLSHSYGSQPYDNHDNSRNNYIVGILTFGEGFQNTHHQYPSIYKLHNHDIVGHFINAIKR